MDSLPAGIPTFTDYCKLLSSSSYKELENFSDSFLRSNSDQLHDYETKWVKDPFHNWSRQWEYPFVYFQIKSFLKRKSNISILDAGSGITFFPYFLLNTFPSIDINCCDIDTDLGLAFSKINGNLGKKVHFKLTNLENNNFKDNQFDVIYCISVLEHTDNFPEVVTGLYRILKPEGRLIVTFDISLDNKHDISPERAEYLVNILSSVFNNPTMHSDPGFLLSKPDIVTTSLVYKEGIGELPWNPPTIKRRILDLIKGEGFNNYPRPVTFYCLSLDK